MVAGICVDCGHPVGSGTRMCPHCGCAEPMPAKATHRCVSCGNGLMSDKRPCTHCGAPDPLDSGPIVPALVRCGHCGNPTHVAAANCRKCRTAISQPASNGITPSFHGATETDRTAAAIRNATESQVYVARPISGGSVVDGGSGVRAAPESARVPAPERITCGCCGELQASGAAICPRCGVASPGSAAPALGRKSGKGFRLWAGAIVCLVAAAVLVAHAQVVKAGERKQRIREALGSDGSEDKIAEIVKEAAEIGVSTDALLRVRAHCLSREVPRPAMTELRHASIAAEAVGSDPEIAVMDAAHRACGK